MTFFNRSTRVLSCFSIAIITTLTLIQPLTAFAAPTPKKRVVTDQSTVIVKFKQGASVDLQNDRFARNTGRSLQTDNQLESALDRSVVSKKRLIASASPAAIKDRREHFAVKLPAGQGDLENYYTLKLAPGQKADDVAARLKKLDTVETAYAKPLPLSPPTAPSMVDRQTHLKAAPVGLGVNPFIGDEPINKTYPGALGGNVKVVDFEYGWNTQHEDLSVLRKPDAYWKNGTPQEPSSNDFNHGTATVGVIAADLGNGGVDGIAPKASLHIANASNYENGFVLSESLYLAANKMATGDVMLIELQATSPDNSSFAPIEILPDVYDAIQYATAKGIIVIEPAGNGKMDSWEGMDLDDPLYHGAFTTKASSGAIMVGAGGGGCNSDTPVRARNTFSNYGSRVDVQGVGDCVVTTGYGTMYGNSPNEYYTGSFSGTSSASATIAGLAASLSSSYSYTNKKAMTSEALKAALLYNAQPQNMSANPGHVGPRPNMAFALKKTDFTKPTVAKSLTGKYVSRNKISLAWKASTDNLPYIRYNVYRNNVLIAKTMGLNYTDTSLKAKGAYTYKVVATDASYNVAAASNSVKITNK